MDGISVSQNELDLLLNSAKMQKAAAVQSPTFSISSMKKKYEMSEAELKQSLIDQHVTIKQSEVDALIKPHTAL